MDETPTIEIFGRRVVHLDRCQIGHISDQDGTWRFWFWPEYDARLALPVTEDLSHCLHDIKKLRDAVRGPLLRSIAKTPNMSYRAVRHMPPGVAVPGRPCELRRPAVPEKALKEARIVSGT